MSVDMGGICWPTKGGAVTSGAIGSAKLDRQVAYAGNTLQVTATGTDGQPYGGTLEVVLRERSGAELHRTATGGVLSLAGIPTGRYRVTVNGTSAGPLAVL